MPTYTYIFLHDETLGIVKFDGNYSKPLNIRSGVKQGCFLALTLFEIFFFVRMLKQAFGNATEEINRHTRSDDSLFNLSRLKEKSMIRRTLIHDMLFDDDAALVADSQDELQCIVDHQKPAQLLASQSASRRQR